MIRPRKLLLPSALAALVLLALVRYLRAREAAAMGNPIEAGESQRDVWG